jgi:hypothetical protein
MCPVLSSLDVIVSISTVENICMVSPSRVASPRWTKSWRCFKICSITRLQNTEWKTRVGLGMDRLSWARQIWIRNRTYAWLSCSIGAGHQNISKKPGGVIVYARQGKTGWWYWWDSILISQISRWTWQWLSTKLYNIRTKDECTIKKTYAIISSQERNRV